MDRGGYLVLTHGNEVILTTAATQSIARQIGDNRVVFHGVFEMNAHDSAVGKSVNFLREAQSAQISFLKMDPEAHVIQGSAVLTINSTVRLEMQIPEQKTTTSLIIVPRPVDSLPVLP
jgi:hypothetical protein